MKPRTALATASAIATILLSSAGLAGGNQFKLLKLEGEFAKWQSSQPGGPTVISYAFVDEVVHHADARNCAQMQPVGNSLSHSNISEAQFRHEFTMAADMWEEAANIRFVEAKSPQSADILVGLQVKGFGRAFTNVELASEQIAPATRRIKRSLICLNPEVPWKIGFDGNLSAYDLRYTLAHELGHAIGLDHPIKAGSLMFYRYDETQRGLTVGDMVGAATIYGAGPLLAAKRGIDDPSSQYAIAEQNTPAKGEEDHVHSPPSFALGAKP